MPPSAQQTSHNPQQHTAHELAVPLLCFLASHRPVAFFANQCWYLLEPMLAILGLTRWRTVAQTWLAAMQHDRLDAMLATNSPQGEQGVPAEETASSPSGWGRRGAN